MRLTRNFKLGEFCHSATADRLGINNSPSEAVIDNLRRLCVVVLQPLRDKLKKPILVTSGYRCRELNEAVGGAPTSQHLQGEAADIVAEGVSPEDLAKLLVDMERKRDVVIYDQLVVNKGVHLHVSVAAKGNRFQALQYDQAAPSGFSKVEVV